MTLTAEKRATELARWRASCKCAEDHQHDPACDGEVCVVQRDAIAAVLTALQSDRNAVIEECAKIADGRLIDLDAGFGWGCWTPEEHALLRGSAMMTARSIRALIVDQKKPPGGDRAVRVARWGT